MLIHMLNYIFDGYIMYLGIFSIRGILCQWNPFECFMAQKPLTVHEIKKKIHTLPLSENKVSPKTGWMQCYLWLFNIYIIFKKYIPFAYIPDRERKINSTLCTKIDTF